MDVVKLFAEYVLYFFLKRFMVFIKFPKGLVTQPSDSTLRKYQKQFWLFIHSFIYFIIYRINTPTVFKNLQIIK